MTIQERAKSMAGNHQEFGSFAWFDRPDDSENWMINYTHNRDSGLTAQSNAATIAKAMKPFCDGDDCLQEDHSHWACGWLKGYAIRVYAKDGQITSAFKAWHEIQDRMEEYIILDESDFGEREYDAAIDSIKQRSHLAGDKMDEEWASKIYGWLCQNDCGALDNKDDTGAWPSDEAIGNAALGIIAEQAEEVA